MGMGQEDIDLLVEKVERRMIPGPVETLLREAWQKISTPEKWCQGSYAYDERGFAVLPESKRAVRWCSVGAIEAILFSPGVLLLAALANTKNLTEIRQSKNNFTELAYRYLREASTPLGFYAPRRLNDATDWETVKEMYETAIFNATKDGA